MKDIKMIMGYKNMAIEMLKLKYPNLTNSQLNEAIEYSINKRYKKYKARIFNSYKNEDVETDLLSLIDYIEKVKPIITPYGVMIKKPEEERNLLDEMIQGFIRDRNKLKKMMFKYEKASEMFEKYNLAQSLAKIDANAAYGAMGMYKCVLFNYHIASSTTGAARSIISAAAMAFEMFLANNVKFRSLDEVVTFIYNVKNEKNNRKFIDSEIIDRNIDFEEVFVKIMNTCGHGYIPNKKEAVTIYNIIFNLNQEDLNRLYYKNNLYEFIENSKITNMVIELLKMLKLPYMDPNEKPDEISEELELFWEILNEYVCYNHNLVDRIERLVFLPRKVTAIIDTDSNIICLDRWYQYIKDKIEGIDMAIKNITVDGVKFLSKDEFGDIELRNMIIDQSENDLDYDFFNDELLEVKKTIDPINILAEDGVRYSIINILSYCCYKYINNYMKIYARNCNTEKENVPCSLIMKNEFLFKRVLLMNVKKNYASIQELQEGNIIPKGLKSLDIKGLPLMKAGLNKNVSKELISILYEDVLNIDTVDQVKIMKRLKILEKKIYNSLLSGKKEFYKPVKVKSMYSYENPTTNGPFRACLLWNELTDDSYAKFNLEENNAAEVVKITLTSKNVNILKDDYPNIYAKAVELLSNKQFSSGFSSIAVPYDSDVPEWIFTIIDYSTIINDNLSNFPLLFSTGMYSKENINYSNIVSF